jgi:RNA polymerase sigma-70 factor, ECF subfamily
VNGRAGIVSEAGEERSLLAFTVDAGRITAIDAVRNPDKLGRVPRAAS